MIGSHNTFTYLKPTNPIFNLFKRYWRCQEIDAKSQYEIGVRCFDIRIFRNKKDHWQLCHGLVNLNLEFVSIQHLCHYIESNYPEVIYRIVFEKGSYKDEEIFYRSILEAYKEYKHLWRGVIPNNWKGIKGSQINYRYLDLNIWEYPNKELSGLHYWNYKLSLFKNITNILKSNIKKDIQKLTENEIYLSENNITNKTYVILSDYINLIH